MYMSIPLFCALLFPSSSRMYILDRARCSEMFINCQLRKDCLLKVELSEKFPGRFIKSVISPVVDSKSTNQKWHRVQ